MGIFWEFSLVWWPPIRYAGGMGKNIRQTLTITLTETWIIAWVTDDDPLGQAVTVVENTPNPKEEPDEYLQATLSKPKSGKPRGSDHKKRPRTLEK